MSQVVTSKDIIDSAKKCPLEKYKNFSHYISSIKNEIQTSGLNVRLISMGLTQQGRPIFILDKKNRPVVAGESFSFNAPSIGHEEHGYIIEETFNMKIQITVFVIKKKLYLSSYSYHFELLRDKTKFFRYEKSEYVAKDDIDYKPEFHMHCMGRLPHYPTSCVTVGQLLRNLKTNIFNPANYNRLNPPWGLSL